MAEHVMRIACQMLNAFVEKALRANSVRWTNDQQLQLQVQPRPKVQMHRLDDAFCAHANANRDKCFTTCFFSQCHIQKNEK